MLMFWSSSGILFNNQSTNQQQNVEEDEKQQQIKTTQIFTVISIKKGEHDICIIRVLVIKGLPDTHI